MPFVVNTDPPIVGRIFIIPAIQPARGCLRYDRSAVFPLSTDVPRIPQLAVHIGEYPDFMSLIRRNPFLLKSGLDVPVCMTVTHDIYLPQTRPDIPAAQLTFPVAHAEKEELAQVVFYGAIGEVTFPLSYPFGGWSFRLPERFPCALLWRIDRRRMEEQERLTPAILLLAYAGQGLFQPYDLTAVIEGLP